MTQFRYETTGEEAAAALSTQIKGRTGSSRTTRYSTLDLPLANSACNRRHTWRPWL